MRVFTQSVLLTVVSSLFELALASQSQILSSVWTLPDAPIIGVASAGNERHAQRATAALVGKSGAGLVNQRRSYVQGHRGKKMRTIFPVQWRVQNAQNRLMQQLSRE